MCVGSLCWAARIRTLFGTDYFAACVYQWRIPSFREVSLEAGVERPIDLRVQLRAMESPAVLKRIHTDSAGHSSSINHMLWIDHIETVVTAGMDK